MLCGALGRSDRACRMRPPLKGKAERQLFPWCNHFLGGFIMEHIQYLKTDSGLPKLVTYYFDIYGQGRFEEQRVDEGQFSRFTPSEEERQVAHQIRDEVTKEG